MRNELQLTPFDNAADGLEYHNPAPGNGHAGAATGRGADTYKRIHKMLRGRYKFVFPVSLVLALCFGVAGYKSQEPIYQSVGLIGLKPTMQSALGGDDKDIHFYDEFLQNQVLVMSSRTVIDKAMADPAWVKLGRPMTQKGIKLFVDSMEVDHPEHSQCIRVTFSDRDADAAQVGAKAILDAYEAVFKTMSLSDDSKQMDIMEGLKHDDERQLQAINSQLADLSKDYGSHDISQLYSQYLGEIGKLQVQLTAAQLVYELSQQNGNVDDKIKALTDRQIAMLDDTHHMSMLQENADKAESDLRLMRARVGPNNPGLIPYQQGYDDANNRMQEYGRDWRSIKLQMAHNPNAQEGNEGIFGIAPDTAKANLAHIQSVYDTTKTAMVTLGNKQEAMNSLSKDKARLDQSLQDVSGRIDTRLREGTMGDTLEHVADPQIPFAPAKDRRIHMAGLLGAVGFMLPLVFLGFGAMFDKRYRYSDEASAGIGQTPLLGILPTLPDKLENPEQASIAAHCIHQIRIMLQMGRDEQNRRVFMMTSASTGDGKTSMALALGLSFAASGARTLLVDADIIGQGLSHRMRLSGSTGLCETILTGTMQGHVQKSSNKGLWVLPIGNSDDFNAGMMSPVSIRKLIAESKQHFDYILIDTGPALGSLEASLVAPEVDQVVIAVSRGQNQQLVERTLEHLRGMGAKIAGIVFNRAEKRDSHRSVVSSSIRSLSAKPSTPRGLVPDSEENARLGPLARSVVSFLPTTGQGDLQA